MVPGAVEVAPIRGNKSIAEGNKSLSQSTVASLGSDSHVQHEDHLSIPSSNRAMVTSLLSSPLTFPLSSLYSSLSLFPLLLSPLSYYSHYIHLPYR